MKFPQAYVFFKFNSAVKEQDVRSRFDENVDLAFINLAVGGSSATHSRANYASRALIRLGHAFHHLGTCAVVSTRKIDDFFLLKFRHLIEEIVWIESSSDAHKIRSTLTLYFRYLITQTAIYRALINQKRIVQIYGDECPDCLINDQLFSELEIYEATISGNAKLIFDEFDDRLKNLCHVGKYSI